MSAQPAASSAMHAVPPPPPVPPAPPAPVPVVASEVQLVDQTTGERHRLFIRDGALIWDNGGSLPMIAVMIVNGSVVVEPVEPAEG